MVRPGSETRGETRREAILDAVVGVIIDVGFTDMTVADVARRAGVSTALVHYHFDSKAALISAALRVASDDDKLLRTSTATDSAPALDRLDRVLCGSLPADSAADASWLLWIETWGETRRSAEIREVMADLNEHERTTILELLREGVAAGEFDCGDPLGTANRLMAVRDGLAIEHTLFDGGSADETTRLMRAALAHELGLRAESDGPRRHAG